jgi:hypothetical protein
MKRFVFLSIVLFLFLPFENEGTCGPINLNERCDVTDIEDVFEIPDIYSACQYPFPPQKPIPLPIRYVIFSTKYQLFPINVNNDKNIENKFEKLRSTGFFRKKNRPDARCVRAGGGER